MPSHLLTSLKIEDSKNLAGSSRPLAESELRIEQLSRPAAQIEPPLVAPGAPDERPLSGMAEPVMVSHL